jgi:hypothetical protein
MSTSNARESPHSRAKGRTPTRFAKRAFVKGVFDINAESYCDSGVPFLRILNLRKGVIDDSNLALIPEWVHKNEIKTELRRGDIVFSKTAYPAVSLVTLDRCNTSQDTIATSLSEYGKSGYTPETIVAYLNSTIGQRLLWRQYQGNVQLHLSLDDGRKVPIPKLGAKLQSAITQAFTKSQSARNASEQSRENAEQTLVCALGLENWQAPEPLSYVRNSLDAFTAGRFDAEYFYPAKTAALGVLTALSNCTVGDLFDSVRNLWQPTDGNSSERVRNYDLSDALTPFLDGNKEPVERAVIASTKKMIQAGDLVVSRLRSYLKEIAIVQPSEGLPMVASTEFIVLRPKSATTLPIEALLVYLRSTLPQLVFKWSQDGSNHPRFDERELLRLPVPGVLIAQANDYFSAIQSMITARERATQLLDAAKRAVEIAIEDSEAAALAYLEAKNSCA